MGEDLFMSGLQGMAAMLAIIAALMVMSPVYRL